MKKAYIFLDLSVLAFPQWFILVAILVFPTTLWAAPPAVSITSLPYSTSALSCTPYTQPSSPWDEGYSGCDKINYYGDWGISGVAWQLTSAANYSGGEGGLGTRQWFGSSNNAGSSTTWFNFNPRPTELWIRYYARWQAGFNAANTNGTTGLWQKMIYIFNTGTAPSVDITVARGNGCWMEGYSPNFTTYGTNCGANQLGFDPVTQLSNGQWNLIEYHFKLGNPGVIEFWINNVKVMEKLDWYQAGFTGFGKILLPSNNHTLDIPRPMYYDEDDLAFSTTGRIGPYGGAVGSPPPTPPPTPTPPAIQSIQ